MHKLIILLKLKFFKKILLIFSSKEYGVTKKRWYNIIIFMFFLFHLVHAQAYNSFKKGS